MTEQDTEPHANDLVWRYQPVNPETGYDRTRYIFSQDQLNDLESYVGKLKQDPNDSKTRGKLTGLLFGDRNLGLRLPIEQLRHMAKQALDTGSDSMAKYVRRNLDDFLDSEVLIDEGLEHLALSAPLYLTGNEEQDKLAAIIADYQTVSKIAKDGDTGKMAKYITAKLKEKKVPEWVAKTVSALAQISGFAQAIFERYMKASNQLLVNRMYTQSGDEAKLNRKLLESMIRDSIKLAEDKFEDETDEGKRGDIWDDDLKPILYAIANEPFGYVKEKYERDEIPELREREDQRHARRMAA